MPVTHYDLLAIAGSQHAPEAVEKILDSLKTLLTEAGGEVLHAEVIGKRKLAYPIGQDRFGTYLHLDFNLDGKDMMDVNRKLRLMDEIIRFLPIITKLKTAKELEEEARIQEKIQARRAREEAKIQQDRRVAERIEAAEAPTRKDGEEKAPLTLDELDKKIEEILDEDAVK
jgi:small subunit ribosomal protein S6